MVWLEQLIVIYTLLNSSGISLVRIIFGLALNPTFCNIVSSSYTNYILLIKNILSVCNIVIADPFSLYIRYGLNIDDNIPSSSL